MIALIATMNRRLFLSTATMAAAGALSRVHAQIRPGSTEGAVVETAAGKIRGGTHEKIHFFKGVPYGASTDGARRFLPPAKPQSWTGVRDTFEVGPQAPQLPATLPEFFAMMGPKNPTMSEDCLRLNIWTPNPAKGSKRPVMVWLHGGGFAVASSNWPLYDGTALAAKHDVVLVGVNHRLNLFGFLHLADLGAPKYSESSNLGMLDIVAALQWIRDNIDTFGGDPTNVTIFGESGGAAKVSTLMAMPAAKGLFHRAIVQSGSALKGMPSADASKLTEAFIQKLGFTAGQSAGDFLDGLQKVPVDRLLSTMGAADGFRLSPVVDGRSLPTDPFDPIAPLVSATVPMLIGTNETEITGLGTDVSFDPIDDATLRVKVRQLVPKSSDAALEQLIATYRKGRSKATNLDLYFAIASDARMRVDVIKQAERKAGTGKAVPTTPPFVGGPGPTTDLLAGLPSGASLTFMYYLTWKTPVKGGKFGSPHVLDVPFVFDNIEVAPEMVGTGSDQRKLAERMSNAWVAFARTGNPNHKGLPEWPVYTTSTRATMRFDNDCKVVNDPNREELAALRALMG